MYIVATKHWHLWHQKYHDYLLLLFTISLWSQIVTLCAVPLSFRSKFLFNWNSQFFYSIMSGWWCPTTQPISYAVPSLVIFHTTTDHRMMSHGFPVTSRAPGVMWREYRRIQREVELLLVGLLGPLRWLVEREVMGEVLLSPITTRWMRKCW